MTHQMTASRSEAWDMLDKRISHETGGFGLDDLSDTPVVMSALDTISLLIEEGDRESAQSHARHFALEILGDEGFPFFGEVE